MLDLKRPAQSWGYCDMDRRFEKTIEFMNKHGFHTPVLDIGDKNDFGMKLAESFQYEYFSTIGDLDRGSAELGSWEPALPPHVFYETALCFEVLEHLKNPGQFLHDLKNRLLNNSSVFISFPRHIHPRFWSKTHFHEFDELRARCLFEEAGYEIVAIDKHWLWPRFQNFFTGIRPLLRLLTGYWFLQVPRQYFYLLRWRE